MSNVHYYLYQYVVASHPQPNNQDNYFFHKQKTIHENRNIILVSPDIFFVNNNYIK
jgi:hypothetical protein